MWRGSARSNMARFADVEKLEVLAAGCGLSVVRGPENFAMLLAGNSTDHGGFPSTFGGDDDLEWIDAVVGLLQEDSVLILQYVGADGDRELSGHSTAYVHRADGRVETTSVAMNDIYAQAATQFAVQPRDIADCCCENLPLTSSRP